MSQAKNPSSWWMRIWSFIRFMLVLTIVVGTVYFAVFETNWFVIKEIEISSNNDKTQEIYTSFQRYFEGKNMFLISMEEAISDLKKDPYIAQVELKRQFPDTIAYSVMIREEVAAFRYNDMYLFLDDSGRLLRIGEEADDYLIIEGFPVRSFVVGRPLELNSKEAMANTLKLINLVNQTGFTVQPSIQYEEHQIVLRLNDEFRGKFGNGETIENKYNDFIDIYHDLETKGIYSGVIDVSHKGYPVYKPFGE